MSGITREERQDWVRRGFKDPLVAYRSHRSGAAARGIAFDLTFDEWWEIWKPRWEGRGNGPGQLQMCRTRDEGGYSPGNVRIDTREANSAEAGETIRRRCREWNRANADGDWLHNGYRQSVDYVKMAIRAERAEEAGDPDSIWN